MKTKLLLIAVFCTIVLGTTSLQAQKHPNKASPFDAIRWVEEEPQVQIAGAWYTPVAIDDVEVDIILAFCKKRWPGQLQKRFAEDLMEAMALLGQKPGNSVTLRLELIGDEKEITLEGVPNTLDKRQQLWRDRRQQQPELTPLRPPPSWLSKKQVRQEIATFAVALRDQFAYLELKGIDLDQAIEECIRSQYSRGLPERMPPVDLVMILHRALMRFGDGHARVSSSNFRIGEGSPYIPFLLSESKDGIVAYHPDRSRLLDGDHPIVVSLDGRPIEDLIAETFPLIADGSPQMMRRRALSLIRSVSMWRMISNAGAIDGGFEFALKRPFDVELCSVDGKRTHTVKVTPIDRKPTYRDWPRGDSRRLEKNLGYLRLQRMDEEAVEEVHRWLGRFRNTDGLIVDVRGNGGGSRAALLALAGYLIGEGEGPWVGNFAVYRKSSKFGDDHLAKRFMRPIDSDEWTPAQRTAIDRSFAAFKPQWQIPDGFSEWHALVLDRNGHPQEFPYPKEVVILSDAGCFSATDIFLGALELLPRVTLMGSASSGGSARSQGFSLPLSMIEVRCASMASFRPNGKLYDGNGVEVDVEIEPDPSYFIAGGVDGALESAIDQLLSQKK